VKLIALLALSLVFSCAKKDSNSDRLEISLPQEISTIDPANCYDTVCYMPVTQVYESLYEFEYLKRPYSIRPLLAESLPTISKDRLTYTFKIKPNIKYHESKTLPAGRTVKAQDFVNQIKRLAFLPTRSQGWWLFDGRIKGLNEWRSIVGTNLEKFYTTPVEGLEVIDELTFVIKLKEPYPQLQFALTMNFSSPIPEEAIKALNNDFSQVSVGTGAYYITRYNQSQEVILKKNPHYISSIYPNEGDEFAKQNNLLQDAGSKLPFMEDVRFVVIKEAQTDWLNFLKKKITMINLTKDHYQLALNFDGSLRDEMKKDDIKLQASPTLIYWWLAFNMKDPIVGKNKNLRLAIAHAVNIDKYIELFTHNVAQKANSIYPPGIPGYSAKVKTPYSYNVEKAKEYLKLAGYPGGKGLPELRYDVRGTNTIRRQMGEFIQNELREIGIKVQINISSFPAFLEKSRKGELQFWQGGWVLDYPDSENVLQLLTTANLAPGPNTSNYSNPKFDKLFAKLRLMDDSEKKHKLMSEMETMVNNDLPWVMQYYSRNYILYHDQLKNFRYSDIIYNTLKYLKIQTK